MKQIFITYQQFSEIDIEQAIQVHTEGNLYHTLLAIGIENKIFLSLIWFDF